MARRVILPKAYVRGWLGERSGSPAINVQKKPSLYIAREEAEEASYQASHRITHIYTNSTHTGVFSLSQLNQKSIKVKFQEREPLFRAAELLARAK